MLLFSLIRTPFGPLAAHDVTPAFWFHYTPDALVVQDSSPIRTFQDFVKAAKESAGKISLGGSGLNSANHAAHERMNAAFGFKTTYVPFKGTGDMSVAVLGAQIDGAMTYTPFAIANQSRLRALAVASAQRSEALPDVPTMAELGFAGYEFNTWVGVAVPKGTPREVVDRLRNGLVDTIASPEVKATLREQGAVPVGSTPEQFRRFVADEIAKSSRIVAEAEIQPD